MEGIAEELEDKRAKLEAELARISAPPSESSGISFGKRVGDGTSMAVDRLVDVAAHDHLRALLADVERALSKLQDGSYGVCDRCGADIAPERLEALPWAVLCVRCAGRASGR
jgi:DnaK suppressor protein